MADHALSPSQAAAIADGVYALKERTVAEHRERNAPMSSEDPLLDDASGFSGLTSRRFEARSGSVFWHELSGFGYIAEGAGARAGELLIATRGTATAADALTDANFGFVIGPAGKLVHSGFMTCWKSYSRVLETALRGKSPRRIHCVGHSLGGALAMFNAEHLAQRRVAEVLVYTFGAPRVGDWFQKKSFASSVGADHIYRVANIADPIPMVPLFPYFHVDGIPIDTGAGNIAPSAHRMAGTYAPAMAGKTWGSLQTAAAARQRAIESQAEFDLALARAIVAPMGSAAGYYLIGKALAWLLKKALLVVGGTMLAATATVLDRLAWLVSEGSARCKVIADQAKSLLTAVMHFLGRKAVQAAEVGVAFVRWVLGLLWTSIKISADLARVYGYRRG